MLSALLSVVLVFNELMASNVGEVMSPATNFDSWIELYNPSDEDVDITGMYLSIDPSNPMLWAIPHNIVPAKGFKVLWLGSNNLKDTQAPFHLDCDGGTILLSDASGSLIASETYPRAMSRTSYARKVDGDGEWGWTASATPGATNATSAFASERLPAPTVSVGSKLFSNSFTVKVDIPEGCKLMYTTDGSVPTPPRVKSEEGGTGSEGNEGPILTNWVRNSDCEGEDAACFASRDGDGDADEYRIIDGVGYKGSRGIKVHAIDHAADEWDTQFFIYTPDHVWQSGEHYRFSMMVRADKPANISVQTHTTPHNYIHWSFLNGGFDVTDEWQELSCDGYITAEQAGSSGMQTIAFNLNNDKKLENNYYFDNIVWELVEDVAAPNFDIVVRDNPGKQSTTGTFTVSNTTNYVFRLFRDGYLPSVPVTRSYIKDDKAYTIPVISIVGDDKYYNDDMWGIDVVGKNGESGKGMDYPVNWNMDWDRPVNFSLISPEGEMLFNQDVNTCVSGGWSRKDAPRSFKLKSNKMFDDQNHLDYVFFPQKPYIRSKALLVRNGGNDGSCRFMDPAMTSIVYRSGIDLDVQSTTQVAEYINGEFRGVMNLRETNNDKFVYANWGYDDDEIDAFENFEFNNGDDEAWKRLLLLSEHAADDAAYDEVKRLLDIDEFTNYMAVEMFLGNSDWPNNNVKGYRSRNDGRFRFILFDLDQIFNRWCDMKSLATLDGQFYDEPLVQLFRNLLQRADYRRKFLDTFCIMGGSVFEYERLTAMINEMADAMRPMLQLEGRSPNGTANEIKDKMRTRFADVLTQLDGYAPAQTAGLHRQSVQLSADTEGAHILLNGVDLPYAAFKGHLFPPVTLEAKAPAGYRFAGWSTATATASNRLIATDDSWKYYDQGELSGNAWRTSSFSDDSWASGPAPLGYKMQVATTVSYGSDANKKNPTTYFRKTITLDGTPTANDVFQLNYQVDDGFVVYVNGQEAGRYNMTSGTVSYSSYSSTYAGDIPASGTLELQPSLFHSGDNVIAVEVHNTSATSSDLYWACELCTSVGTAADGYLSTDPVIAIPNQDDLTLTAVFEPLSETEKTRQYVTPVRINEVSAANAIFVNDYWKKNDWIELYNTTDQPIDVEGMYLTDNISKPQKYQITKSGNDQISTVIPAHGYLVVWCDKLVPITQLHATFKLASSGGDVMLTAADESWNDVLTYGNHYGDQTVGRYPDGTNDVCLMTVPTIAKANVTSSYAEAVAQPLRPEPGDFIMGDANGDGVVNIVDVTTVISYILGQSPEGFNVQAADVNGDAHVDIVDVTSIIDIILNAE